MKTQTTGTHIRESKARFVLKMITILLITALICGCSYWFLQQSCEPINMFLNSK